MATSKLLGKLLVAVLLPTAATFAGFGLLCHLEAQRALEAELGRRLAAVAAAAAAQVSEESVALLAPGDEESRTYRNLRRRLLELRDATGARRLYLFAEDLTARVDTDGAPIGERLYGLDASRTELRTVFAGRPASSLLFRGRDGQLYKSGYAPVASSAGRPAFAVGVDGSAALYQDLLALRRTLAGVGSLGLLAMVALAVLLGRRIAQPLGELTRVARTIEQGVLGQPVPAPLRSGRDEVAVLAQGLEEMRRGLAARDERLQMMLSGIAHEVRNPLGGMELFAGLLRDELAAPRPDAETARGYVARVEREIHHLKAVVNDFLEYARRPRPQLEPLEVGALLHEVAESAQASAPTGVEVAVEPGPPGVRCPADPTQLRRALLNLAQNGAQACAAAEGPGRVTLTWRADGAALEIAVADTGPGIAPEILPKIWTPFFTTRQQGTGLGLAFVREIVADHGGDVRVDTGPGGTRFVLSLPTAPGAARQDRA